LTAPWIPTRFQRHGGGKRIVGPDGSAIVPNSKPQPDGTLVKVPPRPEERAVRPAQRMRSTAIIRCLSYSPEIGQ